jgi:acyl-CoA hydrolase
MSARVVTPEETRCEMTQIVMPSSANALGTVFGGQVMAWIDICAAVSASRFTRTAVVTASMDSLLFKAPVLQGEVVVLQATVNWAGRTSMEVGVRVESENRSTGVRTHTSTAYLTFVSLDADRRPQQVPTLSPQTPKQQIRWDNAVSRRKQRLALRQKALDRERQG